MTTAETPMPDDAVKNALVARYEAETAAAQEQTNFWRGQTTIWRRVALGFGTLIVAIGVTAVLILNATHQEGSVTRHKADQTLSKADKTLTIAREFECQQTPTPKGCPPQPPQPAVSPGTEAIINDVISRIEQVYPPPNGLR